MPWVERDTGVIVAAYAVKQTGVAEEFVTPLTYNIDDDMPPGGGSGKVNTVTLEREIRASAITTNLFGAWEDGNILSILFDTLPLPAGDKTILDNDTSAPAGGLLAAHSSAAASLPIDHIADATLPVGGVRAHTNKGATAQVILTLPDPMGEDPNLPYTFCVFDAQNFRIKADTGHTLRYNSFMSVAGGYVENSTVGGLLTLLPFSDTEWVISSQIGTWVIED